MVRQKPESLLGSCLPSVRRVIEPRAFSALISGLLFGLSLIVAIGPQNAFVVRQGALRAHVPVVVAICAVSDLVLIAAGVSGTGAALAGRPWLRDVTRIAGAAVLVATHQLSFLDHANRCVALRDGSTEFVGAVDIPRIQSLLG